MRIMQVNQEYQRLIRIMTSEYDLNGEIPSAYSENFQNAVCEKLMKDETGMIYTHYRYIPLFERDYQYPELLQLICKYIKADGDPDIEKKYSLKIAELLVKNITRYFRDDIENDIEITHIKEYKSNDHLYTSNTDYCEI